MSITPQGSGSPGSGVIFGRNTHDELILANYDSDDYEDDDDYVDLEHLSEGKARYDSGWFYPICIGDRIKLQAGSIVQDRYQISHRLSWGGFYTVWMAHDLAMNEAVALKVLGPGKTGDKEYNMQELITHPVQNPSHLLLCKLEDTFLLSGPKGTIWFWSHQ